jgi:hypothetical protein
MSDWGFYAFTMHQAYRDRLREAEESRLIRQAEAGRERRFRVLARMRAWLERGLATCLAESLAHVHNPVKEAATDSRVGGSLIL